MIAVESLQAENRVVKSVLHALAEEGLVTVVGEDEEEMSETTLHFELVNYLFNALKLFFGERENVFVASNLRISYDEQNPLRWFAPDVLVAFETANRERSSYDLKTEGQMPQIIFEIASSQTAYKDMGEKYNVYARLGVEEYYLLDPERNLLPDTLMAYQRKGGKLLPVEIQNRRVFSPRLNLEIVDTGVQFRLFDSKNNEFLRSPEEIAARLVELEALLKQK